MKTTMKNVVVIWLIAVSTSVFADPILSIDADTSMAGIQDSLTVNLGDTFSVVTLVTTDSTLDLFDTVVFNLDDTSDILILDAVFAGALAGLGGFGLVIDPFSGALLGPGSLLTLGGVSGDSIGMSSLGAPFGGFLGLPPQVDFDIALFTFTAASMGTTNLSMSPDLINPDILALGGQAVASQTFSATITVVDNVVAVPEPGTFLLLLTGLGAILLRGRRSIISN